MKILGILCVIGLLAGCSSGPQAPSNDEARPKPSSSQAKPETVVDLLPTVATLAWSVKLQALQNPVVVGDTLVTVAAARGNEMDIVALDRESGDVLWRRPLMATDNALGGYFGALVYESKQDGDFVVYQEAETGAALVQDAARPYVAVDPSTGKVLAKTRPVVSSFGPVPCRDGKDVCLSISGDDISKDTRWVLGSWKLRAENDPFPIGTNSLVEGSDVYTIHESVDGYFAAGAIGRRGKTSWRLSYQRVTGKKTGWLLNDDGGLVDDESGVAVVQLTRLATGSENRRYLAGKTVRMDASRRRTAGIDVKTGKVLWRHQGADFGCLELTRYEIAVRCAFQGSVVHRKAWDGPRLEKAVGAIEGYDPATGETTWRHELDHRAVRILLLRAREYGIALDRFADADELAILPTKGHARLVSLVDGSSRPVTSEESRLCTRKVPFRYKFDIENAGGLLGDSQRRVRFTREPCDSRGKVSTAPIGPDALVTGAVDAGEGTWVFAGVDTLEAYEVS